MIINEVTNKKVLYNIRDRWNEVNGTDRYRAHVQIDQVVIKDETTGEIIKELDPEKSNRTRKKIKQRRIDGPEDLEDGEKMVCYAVKTTGDRVSYQRFKDKGTVTTRNASDTKVHNNSEDAIRHTKVRTKK